MTSQQLRANATLTARELAVVSQLPREQFVPEAYRDLAYADLAISLPQGQRMLTPTLIGRIIEALDPQRTDRVLEIGTGSGYLSASLGLLTQQVRSLEIHEPLVTAARRALRATGIGNVEIEHVDAFAVLKDAPAYDLVVFTGSMPTYDANLERLLAENGRMFVVIGETPVMEAQLILRQPDGILRKGLFETVIPALQNVAACPKFTF